jgi:hypothetical protein
MVQALRRQAGGRQRVPNRRERCAKQMKSLLASLASRRRVGIVRRHTAYVCVRTGRLSTRQTPSAHEPPATTRAVERVRVVVRAGPRGLTSRAAQVARRRRGPARQRVNLRESQSQVGARDAPRNDAADQRCARTCVANRPWGGRFVTHRPRPVAVTRRAGRPLTAGPAWSAAPRAPRSAADGSDGRITP